MMDLLHAMEAHMRQHVDYSGRNSDVALYWLLSRWKDELPALNGYFHKAFQQVDCVDRDHGEGCVDMAIHALLDESDLFWEMFGRFTGRDGGVEADRVEEGPAS